MTELNIKFTEDDKNLAVETVVDGEIYRVFIKKGVTGRSLAIADIYTSLHRNIEESVAKRKYRVAVVEQWLDNIAKKRGDAFGETIPSEYQIHKRLEK